MTDFEEKMLQIEEQKLVVMINFSDTLRKLLFLVQEAAEAAREDRHAGS